MTADAAFMVPSDRLNKAEAAAFFSAPPETAAAAPRPGIPTTASCLEIAAAGSRAESTVARPETPTAVSPPETQTAMSTSETPGTSCSERTIAAAPEAAFVAPGADFFRSAPCETVFSNVVQQQQQRTASTVIMHERRKRDRPAAAWGVATSPPAATPADTPPSPAAESVLHADAGSRRPQRPRRPPRKFDTESADPDISFKKALEKSLLETRRMEVDYASLPSIPEIKIASFDEFLVNPVAFYERLEHYGREFGGVKVVPPAGWKPPFSLRGLLDDALEFNVRAQDIHKLMQGAKFRHPAEPQRASGLQAKDREMKQRLFGTEKPVLQQIEALYWQSVETSSPELTVHYAADLKTNEVGSGFPTDKGKKRRLSEEKTASSYFSAAATSRCPASVDTEACCCKLPRSSGQRSCAASLLQTPVVKKYEANAAEYANGDAGHGATEDAEENMGEGTRAISADSFVSREAESAKEKSTGKEGGDAPLVNIASSGDSSCLMKAEEDSVEKKRKVFFPKDGKDGVAAVATTCEAVGQADESAFYAWHPWNLTRFARQQGSLLSSYHKDVAGVTSPWLYVGMVFSTFCWHAEDNYFAACNYHHWGDAKVWYIIPPSRAPSVERMLQRYLNTKDSDYVLHSLTVQLPPSLFIQHRVPVYRVEQKENEFVILWPRTYHAGFNAGFNCNEACNFAPASWLPWGHRSVKSYRFMRSTCIPFHQLLLRAACTAEGLAASQLLYLCQAVMRLLHEEYALRRAAKEEHVATGLMFLDRSHVSQLDQLVPEAGGVGAELLSCRRELERIVGKPLLPDNFLRPHTAASNNDTAVCRSKIAETDLARTTPLEGDCAAQCIGSLAKDPSAEEGVCTATKMRSFLEVVADVASLPVKDCDNCRSCCAISCFTCPHTIEHNCLECLGQQTCSCKLQVALVRFSLSVLWAVFDYLRSLFLVVCKKEEEAAAQRQSSCAGNAGNNTTCKERRQCCRNVPSNVEEYGGNGRDDAHIEERPVGGSLPDAAEHTQSDEANIRDTWTVVDGTPAAEENPAVTVGVEIARERTNQSLGEERDVMCDKTKCSVTTTGSLHLKGKSEVRLCAERDPDQEAVHGRSSQQSNIGSTSLSAAGEGEVLKELLLQQEADVEVSASRSASELEGSTPQQKRAHRGGCRRSRERLCSGSGQGHSRNKRKQDELLQDPLYIALPSLEELVLFENAAHLLDSFSKEYSKCRGEEEVVNQNIAVVENGGHEDGGKGARKQRVLQGVSKQKACLSGTQGARDRTKDDDLSEGTQEENEENFPLGVAAPSSVTFEEKRGSLFMRGENWSLTALVSCHEAEALEMVKGEEIWAESASKNVPEDGGTRQRHLAPEKSLCDSMSSLTSRECSQSTSPRDTSISQSSRQPSPMKYSLKSRRVAERRRTCTAGALDRETMRGTDEKRTRRRRNPERNAEKQLCSAEQAMMTLVRQLTWRYFLSALKDEEEDNDERILPVFRKAGMPPPKDGIMN